MSVGCSVLLSLLWCGVAPGAMQQQPALDQDFRLAAGRSVVLTDTDLGIRFVGVENDSRCPTDAQCVTAGDAVVAVTLTSGRSRGRRYELHTNGDPRDVTHGGYRVALVALHPLPVSSHAPKAGEYVATFRANRVPEQARPAARIDLR